MEFTVDNTSLAVIKNAEIVANFGEMKAWLSEVLTPYRGMVVTADAIKDSKKDLAKVRKVKQTIDGYRKSIKQECMSPVAEFEAKCKELTGLCDEAIENIDTQVKAFEEEEREAKIDSLKQYFEQAEKEFPEYMCFNDIVKPEWGNKSYNIDKAHVDIDMAIRQIDADVRTISSINRKWKPFLLEEYKQNHDFRKVMAMNAKYDQIEREDEENKRRYEESKAKEPIGKTQPHYVPEAAVVRPQYVEEHLSLTAIEEDEELSITFTVSCTEAKLNALQRFMDSNGIDWKVV